MWLINYGEKNVFELFFLPWILQSSSLPLDTVCFIDCLTLFYSNVWTFDCLDHRSAFFFLLCNVIQDINASSLYLWDTFLRLVLFLYSLFPPSSPFLILGPLTKKQNDDLGDNDGAEDEGIFFDAKLICMTRKPSSFFLLFFLNFLSFFSRVDFFFFFLLPSVFAGCVLSFLLDVLQVCHMSLVIPDM